MADDSSEAYELLNRITDEYMDRMQRGDRPTADGVLHTLSPLGRGDPRSVRSHG